MKITDIEKFRETIRYLSSRLYSLEEIIRGDLSPCELCIGCEMQDLHKGTCNGFRQKEEL